MLRCENAYGAVLLLRNSGDLPLIAYRLHCTFKLAEFGLLDKSPADLYSVSVHLAASEEIQIK